MVLLSVCDRSQRHSRVGVKWSIQNGGNVVVCRDRLGRVEIIHNLFPVPTAEDSRIRHVMTVGKHDGSAIGQDDWSSMAMIDTCRLHLKSVASSCRRWAKEK